MKNKNIFPLVVTAMITLIFFSCNNGKKSEAPTATAHAGNEVQHVVGLGKVEPENGILELAADVSGVVLQRYKSDGDTVRKGETILELSQRDQQLKISEVENQIQAMRHTIASNQALVQEKETKISHAADELTVSEQLLATGGETAQQVAQQKTDLKTLQDQLSSSRAQVDESRANLAELNAQLALAKENLGNRLIKAPADGVILNMQVNQGEALKELQRYAIFAPSGPLVIRGEVDELYAHLLRIGQKVVVHPVGDPTTTTTGTVTFLSPGLNDKSIFAEVPGEAQDRRVRRFKVLLDDTPLLINTKVSCDIILN